MKEEDNKTYISQASSVCADVPNLNWPFLKRDSVWAPKFKPTATYTAQMNHYSGLLLDRHNYNQAILDAQKPTTGKYRDSRGIYGKRFYMPQDEMGIYVLRYSPNGEHLLVGYGSGLVESIDLEQERAIVVKPSSNVTTRITSIKYDPNDEERFFFSSLAGMVYSCSPSEDYEEEYEFNKVIKEVGNEIEAMDIDRTGTKIATAGKDAKLKVYDMETFHIDVCYRSFKLECDDPERRLLEEDEVEGHYLRICAVVFDPDDPMIVATGGHDSSIKVWDLRVPRFAVRNIDGPHIINDGLDIMRGRILSGQWATREGLQVWDMGSSRLLKTIAPWNASQDAFGDYIYLAKYLKGWGTGVDGDLVIAGGLGTGALEVISLRENLVIARFTEDSTIVAADNYVEKVSHGGMGHILAMNKFYPHFVPGDDEASLEPIQTFERKNENF